MAEFVWAFLGEALGWNCYPSNMQDLLEHWLKGGFGVNYQMGLSFFACFKWAMWTVRNKIYIQKPFPERPIDVVYMCISFVQKWTLLMRPLEKGRIHHMVELVLRRAREFRPSPDAVSDVGFI
jgi:hypothetical protein